MTNVRNYSTPYKVCGGELLALFNSINNEHYCITLFIEFFNLCVQHLGRQVEGVQLYFTDRFLWAYSVTVLKVQLEKGTVFL